jgi:alpha-tubulin suppressor-like RCC1 family protein
VRRGGARSCWGENGFGQLGLGGYEDAPHPSPVALAAATDVEGGAGHTCALTAGGAVWCFGDNTYGQLGAALDAPNAALPARVVTAPGGAPLAGVVALSVGDFSSCALAGDGSVWCWGRNESGQLGTGDTENRPFAARIQAECL